MQLDFAKNPDGLVPVIAQDWKTGEILMQAYLNQEAWNATLATGKATYWSRSRKELWVKGETSGHLQIVHQILVDCDLDSVIFKVEALGDVACHLGYRSCFFREVTRPDAQLRHLPQYPQMDKN
jgi:phosphoribosyl-AMP cyclohydrolase